MRRTLGFIFELVARAAHARAHGISTLNHEVGDHAMKDGAVVERILDLLAGGGMRPLALALGMLGKVGDGLGRLFLKQAANNRSLAGFNDGIGTGCAGHSLPFVFVLVGTPYFLVGFDPLAVGLAW